MSALKLLLTFTLFAFLNHVSCNRERKMDVILDALRRIEENLAKEDRLWKITNITRLDFTIGNLNSKVDRLLIMCSGSSSVATGRSETSTELLSNDLDSNMEQIQSKLQSLENSINNVEKSIKSTNFDATNIIEMERRMTQLKDDMNTKIRKMMSVLSNLYELNKDMKTLFEGRSESDDSPSKVKDSTTSDHSAAFLLENLDEMERKIKEQLSVTSSELRSEIASLKIVASRVSDCSSPSNDDDDDQDSWLTPQNNMARRNQGGRSIGNTLDNLMESLGRSTREIREEIQSGIQGIDLKLENLTVLTQIQPRCESLETSESITSSRKVEAPKDLFPAVQDPLTLRQSTERKEKSQRCNKVPHNVPNPKSCADLRLGGATCDGIYVIFPKGVRAVRALCDMTTDGGGWTVLMRRGDYGDKMVSFNRNWMSYKNGFGDTEGEFWLGNDVLHYLTTEESNMLRIHLSAFDGDQIDLDYASFSVSDETNNYKSSLGPVISSPSIAANGFKYHGNRPFSTFDRKNDRSSINCAAQYKGGWWFNGCYQGFLTGEYFNEGEKRDDSQGILWFDWKRNEALKEAAMMIRPKDFTL